MKAKPFTEAQLTVAHFCAHECRRQRSGEVSVAHMIQAWNYVMARSSLDEGAILQMARLIEPEVNLLGWRTVDVRVGHDVKGPWEQVPRHMEQYMKSLDDLDPEEAYRLFEEIHPFRDGNGRTGTLIYNWKRGTLPEPVHPPDWDDPAAYWA